MSVSCHNRTHAPQHGGLSGNVGLYSLELPHRRCRGDDAKLCASGILAQTSGGDIGYCRKTDGRFGSPPACKRAKRYFDRRSGTGLFYRRTAEPCVAGTGRWCCRILARRRSSFRDFDRPWFCGSVDCCRRGGSCNDRSQFAGRSQTLGTRCPPLSRTRVRPSSSQA